MSQVHSISPPVKRPSRYTVERLGVTPRICQTWSGGNLRIFCSLRVVVVVAMGSVVLLASTRSSADELRGHDVGSAPSPAEVAMAKADNGRELLVVNTDRVYPSINEYVDALTSQVESLTTSAAKQALAYENVFRYRDRATILRALVRQGDVFERLSDAIKEADFWMPADVRAQLEKVTQADRLDIERQVRGQVRQVLTAKAQPVQCYSVERYLLAIRGERIAPLNLSDVHIARGKLRRMGVETVSQCATEAQRADPSFDELAPADLALFERPRTKRSESFNEKAKKRSKTSRGRKRRQGTSTARRGLLVALV